MSHRYLFDVSLVGAIAIHAETPEEARAILMKACQCGVVTFDDYTVHPVAITGEASMDDSDPDLVEVDGEWQDSTGEATVGCEDGLHSWIDTPGPLPPDTPCTQCGEPYGYPP